MRLKWRQFRTRVGYIILPIALLLIVVAWFRSFPLGVESRTSDLYDSTSPLYWIGLSITYVGLFLIASNSKNRWERFGCAVALFISTYSITFFFTFPFGPDSNFFRGLTENYAGNGVWNLYYSWPLLFILGTITSRVLGVTIDAVCYILFITWNIVFVGALFLYSNQESPLLDFLAIAAYAIAVNPYMPWQFSAQSFALTLLAVCLIFMHGKGVQSLIATIILYGALVLSHAFLPVFVVLTAAIMSIKDRHYLNLTMIMLLLDAMYIVFQTPAMVAIAFIEYAHVYLEYFLQAAAGLAGPVSPIDAIGRVASLSITISMWALLSFVTYSCLKHRKLRVIDISVHISAVIYAIAGAIGWRAFQIMVIPTTHSLRSVIFSASTRRFLLAYFLLALAIFPLALLRRSYDVETYMTFREEHAADVIFIPTFHADPTGQNFNMMDRNRVYQWLDSQTNTNTHFTDEYAPKPLLTGTAWFKFIFMSPELEKDLVNIAGLSDTQVSQMEANTIGFSRIYSNGDVTVLMNANATELPTVAGQ